MRLLFLSVFLMVTNLSFAQNNPTKEEQVLEILELTGAGEMGVQLAAQITTSFKTSFPQVPAAFWDELLHEINAAEMNNLIVPIYTSRFTSEELNDLLAFYHTETGKKLIAELPGIMQDSQIIGQEWGEELAARVIQRLKENGHIADE